MRWMCQGPGVQVVAKVPVAGPVPPPSIVVTPDMSASSICCGQMKWMCESKPPAVRILPSPAITSVPGPDDDGDAGLDVRIAGLADRRDQPVLEAHVGLHDPPVVEDDGVGDDGVDGAARVGRLRLPHAVADHLAAAELHLFAVGGEVLLDLDDELRIGEANPVAGRGAEHFGVVRAGQGGRGERIAGWGHREDSRYGGEGRIVESRAIERRGGGASELGVDCGQEIVREIGFAAAVGVKRTLRSVAKRDFEVVH